MTVSMLRGEAGNQRKEIEKLVDWLLTEVRPDVVHLSNSMHDRHGADAEAALRPAGDLPALGRRLVPGKAAAAVLRRRPARCCASGRPTSTRSSRSTATTPTSWPTTWRSIAASVHVIPHGLKLDGHGKRIEKRPDEPRVDRLPGPHLRRQGAAPAWSKRASSWRSATMYRRSCCVRPVILVRPTDRTSKRCKQRIAAGPLAGTIRVRRRARSRSRRSPSCNRSTCSACRRSTANRRACRRSRRWPTPCRSCCPTTAAFPKWSPTRAAACSAGRTTRPIWPTSWPNCLRDPIRATQLGLAGQQAIEDRYHATGHGPADARTSIAGFAHDD